MPRGSRKSNKEKLMEKREEIRRTIQQYKDAIVTLEEQELAVADELKRLELQELSVLIEENNLTTQMLKEIIEKHQAESVE